MSEKSIEKKRNSLFQQAALKVFPILRQERTQTFIVIALTLLALSVFGLFAIDPTITTILQLRKQLADDTLVYNKLTEKVQNLSTLQQQYQTLQPNLPLVLAAIPATNNIPEIMGEVQNIAEKTNIQVIAMQSEPLTIVDDPLFKTSSGSFSFTIQGNKADVLNFISRFFNFQRLIVIDQISLSTVTTNNGTATQALIQGKALFKPLAQ